SREGSSVATSLPPRCRRAHSEKAIAARKHRALSSACHRKLRLRCCSKNRRERWCPCRSVWAAGGGNRNNRRLTAPAQLRRQPLAFAAGFGRLVNLVVLSLH